MSTQILPHSCQFRLSRLRHRMRLLHITSRNNSRTMPLNLPSRHVGPRRVIRHIRMGKQERRGPLMGVRHRPLLPVMVIPAAYTHRRCCRTKPDEHHLHNRGKGAIMAAASAGAWLFEISWVRGTQIKAGALVPMPTC